MRQSLKGIPNKITQESTVVCDPTLKFILVPNPQCSDIEGL